MLKWLTNGRVRVQVNKNKGKRDDPHSSSVMRIFKGKGMAFTA